MPTSNSDRIRSRQPMGLALGFLFFSSALSAQEPKCRVTFEGHTNSVNCVAISPDGKTLASGGSDETIRLWDIETGKETSVLKNVAKYSVDSVAFSPDGKTLATGSERSEVKLLDIKTHKETVVLDEVQHASPLVVFSSDGKTLAWASRCDGEIRVWNPATGKRIAKLKVDDVYGVKALAFTEDGKTLASFSADENEIKLWNIATGKNTASLKTDKDAYLAAFSGDGKTLATTYEGHDEVAGRKVFKGGVKLWDVETGKERATLKVDTENVSSLIFSPDGKTLAFGYKNGSIKVWDIAKDKELAVLKGHTKVINCLVYSADGKLLASGSGDNAIKLWDLGKTK